MSWLSKSSSRAVKTAASTPVRERPTEPPRILIDHTEYKAEEFTLGSFRIRPYDGGLIARQLFDFKLLFTLDGELVEAHCSGAVIRQEEQTGLVARYQQPAPFYARKLIEYLRLWKGL